MVNQQATIKCKAQGKNYNLDCITGAVYYEIKQIATAINCVFCGRENEDK